MADSVALIVTDTDGTVYTITGQLSSSIITAVAPPPPAPTITDVQVSAASATVQTNAQVQFGATVQGTGAFDSAVTWAASVGSIDASGLFIAPAVAGSAIITATSTQDASKSGSVTIGVQAPPPPPPPPVVEPTIPAGAAVVDMLPSVIPWQMNHDAGTPGSSTGTTTYPFTAPDGTVVRRFQFTLTAKGGEIYHVNAIKDSSAYNSFCYETVESSSDWSNISCAEKDLEHADPSGTYVDMATQITANSGGIVEITGGHAWQKTTVPADPSKRAANILHTTRIYVKDNGNGTSTYVGILLDSTYYPLGITLNNTGSTKWGKNVLNLQLQYDGKSSGSVQSTVYMHVLRVHAWKE